MRSGKERFCSVDLFLLTFHPPSQSYRILDHLSKNINYSFDLPPSFIVIYIIERGYIVRSAGWPNIMNTKRSQVSDRRETPNSKLKTAN